MIRNVAAALDFDEVHTARRKHVGAEQNVLALSCTSQRYDRRVFDDDPRIGFATFANRFVQPVLQIPNFAVRLRS